LHYAEGNRALAKTKAIGRTLPLLNHRDPQQELGSGGWNNRPQRGKRENGARPKKRAREKDLAVRLMGVARNQPRNDLSSGNRKGKRKADFGVGVEVAV